MTDVPPTRSSDDRALLLSTWTSAGFAVVAVGWGLLTGSRLIIFDGLYSFASVVLSLLAVLALRTTRRGADERYPWGREVWEPLTILVKATALGGLCVYALVAALAEILHGGREVAAGWALLYAFVATAGGTAISLYLRGRARQGSDLVRAEAAEWIGDTLLSLGVLAGFGVALILEATGRADLARYVDPTLVVVISAVFLWVPARLLVQSFREILTMAPVPALYEQVRASVADVEREHAFAESFLRASKVGGRLDVEVDFVVDETSAVQTAEQLDLVRHDLWRRLQPLGYDLSMSVTFTADRRWAL
jgi:cation diffusion facilitator family transporter